MATSCLTSAFLATVVPPLCAAGPPGLTPAQLAGQRIAYPFEGRTPPDWLVSRIERGEAGAVLLFAGNGTDPAAVRRLTDALQAVPRPAALDAPLLVMIDQEGGAVRRLTAPSGMGAGELASLPVAASAEAGDRTGALLCRAGVNVNLAPVADLAYPGSVIDRQGRSFGSDPAGVARRALAFAAGMAPWGVVATPKHFPGLGGATRSTDDVPVSIGLSRARLRAADQAPYLPLIRRGVPMVMVGTAVYPALGARPAALNRRVVTGELRTRLGFGGVVVTDALDTAALDAVGGRARVAVRAAAAGVDLLLYADPAAAREGAAGLARAVASSVAARRRAEASVARILALRLRFSALGPWPRGTLAARPPARGRGGC